MKLGYNFKNKELLNRALTHSSKSADNYERLEFLGDGILDFVVGEYLFKQSDMDEGKLTVLRSHFVSEANLCKVFDKLQLEKDVVLGKSYQGAISKAIKGDIVEAIIAGIYLDSGLERAKEFIVKNLELKTYKSVVDDNYKSKLQELIQSSFKCKMQYVTEKDENSENFTSKFFMDEDEISNGYGQSKLEAEQNAAHVAITKLFKSY